MYGKMRRAYVSINGQVQCEKDDLRIRKSDKVYKKKRRKCVVVKVKRFKFLSPSPTMQTTHSRIIVGR